MNNEQQTDVRYDALVRRDERFDGVFFYGVTSTGVVCRPSCKSRTPRPENVRFFPDLETAQAAGMRPCKRCKPQTAAAGVEQRYVELCRAIERAGDLPSLRELAAISGLSASHVQRRFKAAIGVSPKAYAQTIKRERLRTALKNAATATAALYDAGLNSPSQAYDRDASPLAMTPAQFARGAVNVAISYTIAASAMGRVLIAMTERGVCRVDLDDSDGVLEDRLKAEYPHASLTRTDPQNVTAASLIVAYLAGEGPWPLLPVDVRGTAFQTRVWEALRRIAPGTTASYTELAAMIGSPNAARAVARACASNAIALLIPCHRIVPQSGGTGGYRWNPKRKERLLELERRTASR